MKANIMQISMLSPIRMTKALSPGVAHIGAYCVKWKTRPFQISLNQSMPQKASPANSTFQFLRSTSTE
jgi:hypothetical protein